MVQQNPPDSFAEFSELLLMVVEMTYFRFQGKIFKQMYDMSMGSPLSPSLSNLFMEEFKDQALVEDPHPPKCLGRYVNDTGVVTK